MKPYMLTNENGDTLHPDRFPEKGEQGFVVFSAAGFPEVEHNFDGLTSMYRCWDSHSANSHLTGEFYLTAAEMIVQPVYAERKNTIAEVCTDCPDINGDGYVNVTDLLAVIDAWGIDCDGCSEDVNNDANVNVSDLLIVVGNWGPCE